MPTIVQRLDELECTHNKRDWRQQGSESKSKLLKKSKNRKELHEKRVNEKGRGLEFVFSTPEPNKRKERKQRKGPSSRSKANSKNL